MKNTLIICITIVLIVTMYFLYHWIMLKMEMDKFQDCNTRIKEIWIADTETYFCTDERQGYLFPVPCGYPESKWFRW